MKVAIVEDEISLAKDLAVMLANHGMKEIRHYENGKAFLFDGSTFDLVFMDIQMKEMNGIDTAKELRKLDKHVYIVFLTNDPSYVFDGYEVDAIRYWIKPINEQKLQLLLSSLSVKRPSILWTMEKEVMKLYEDDIYYLESDGHYVICHLKDSKLRKKCNFHNVYEQLSDDFILCHRSYCVNLNHIHTIRKEICCLDNIQTIPVSRSMKQQLQNAFMKKCKEYILCNC